MVNGVVAVDPVVPEVVGVPGHLVPDGVDSEVGLLSHCISGWAGVCGIPPWDSVRILLHRGVMRVHGCGVL